MRLAKKNFTLWPVAVTLADMVSPGLTGSFRLTGPAGTSSYQDE